jgi:hypothetical protein
MIPRPCSQLDNSEEALPSALDRLRALTEPKRVLQLLRKNYFTRLLPKQMTSWSLCC